MAGANLAQRAEGGAAPPPDQGAQCAGVLVADRRGDGVDRLVGRAQQESRLVQADLAGEVGRRHAQDGCGGALQGAFTDAYRGRRTADLQRLGDVVADPPLE